MSSADAGKDFLYFKMAESVKAHLEDQGDGSAELVVLVRLLML